MTDKHGTDTLSRTSLLFVPIATLQSETLRCLIKMASEQEEEQSNELVATVPPFFFLYKDGSVQRSPPGPLPAPSPEPNLDGVASKDLTLDAGLGLWARLFLPPSPPPPHKLPLVLYFHGGGFLFGSPAWNHGFCADMAKRSCSIWVSSSYRLAPENRLPAAFEDGFFALRWLHTQALLQIEDKGNLMDDWLARADFSRCFIAGESAGGNIAHHVVMQAMNRPLSSVVWEPALHIQGLILIHPGFTHEERTQEELDCAQDMMLNWGLVDTCVGLAAPVGANKDHPFINPLSEIASKEEAFVLPRTLVALADKDALHYMVLEYIQALKDAGCSVDTVISQGVGHVFFTLQPESEQARVLFERVSSFITETPV
ncbi:hypothetical protein L7F22_021930 [Adiantum nelumboides]|nr:hypothetical protein [Adiantum nelumboides]